jgi:AcrR family transcriptional regulator
MPRRADPGRRAEVLDGVVDYIADNGISDLSLRPLAEALGQSTYVLTYHFGDKDGLVAAALEHFETRHREMLRGLGTTDPLDTAIKAYWRTITSERNLRLLRLSLQLATSGPPQFGAQMTRDWLEFVTEAFVQRGTDRRTARRDATLLVATITGLLVDLLTTGDRRRVNAALEHYARPVAAAR